MKTYEELAVLEEGEDGAIVEIRGEDGPFALLGAKYLGHLADVLQAAEKNVVSLNLPEDNPLSVLCHEVRTLLRTYDETCLKFHGHNSDPGSYAGAREELDNLQRQLDKL